MAGGGADLQLVVSFLEDVPEAVWLLAGVENPEAFSRWIAARIPSAVGGRLRLLPPRADLRAVFAHCQLYMQLPSLDAGAAFGAMAISEEAAVLARQGSALAAVFYPGQAYATPASAAEILRRLAAEPDLRAKRLRRQRAKLKEEQSLDAFSASLWEYLSEAQVARQTRMTAVSTPAGLDAEERLRAAG
jgi:hypothetical protein